MEITIINGTFESREIIDLISEIVKVKILFQENKINSTSGEEEIKMRENRIKQLQNDLKKLKDEVSNSKDETHRVSCKINVEF